ncbi:hypothetical protein CR513_07928, partial [Mucuna pruriens]
MRKEGILDFSPSETQSSRIVAAPLRRYRSRDGDLRRYATSVAAHHRSAPLRPLLTTKLSL